MKTALLILVGLITFSANAYGPIFSYHLEIETYGEGTTEIFLDEIERDGWKEELGKWGDAVYVLGKRDVLFQDKTISESIGDVEFTIRKTKRGAFRACLGISVGDYDSSSEACTYLNPGVNILEADGGDHTSGSWSFDGKAVIHLK
jgi:hypothetical protein